METKYMEIFQNRGRILKQYTVQFIFQVSKWSKELNSEGTRYSCKLLIASFYPLFYCQRET